VGRYRLCNCDYLRNDGDDRNHHWFYLDPGWIKSSLLDSRNPQVIQTAPAGNGHDRIRKGAKISSLPASYYWFNYHSGWTFRNSLCRRGNALRTKRCGLLNHISFFINFTNQANRCIIFLPKH